MNFNKNINLKQNSFFFKEGIINFIVGCLTGASFAPIYFMPGLFGLSYLCYKVKISSSIKESFYLGLRFGLGYYLICLYWISFALRVYIEEFWWAFPFALFGLPLVLSFFTAFSCAFSNLIKNNSYYPLLFSIIWVFYEWLSSWIFTGLPWALIGYSFTFSLALVQITNFCGIFGLSFIILNITSNLYHIYFKNYKKFFISVIYLLVIILGLYLYGKIRLTNHKTNFHDLNVRLVQPSIPQEAKWELETLSNNLEILEKLSVTPETNLDLIIWPESALIIPINHPFIKKRLNQLIKDSKSILLTGSVVQEGDINSDDFKLFTALQGVDNEGKIVLEYYKTHLVPFGEYIPFKNFLPIKKLTHGLVDYSPGSDKLLYLESLKLYVKALICYECVFPALVRKNTNDADIIINITNDAWYGNSSGPYQHLQINVIRAIENGLPILRATNNGISAIIDPFGRILSKLDLNKIDYLDGKIPKKLATNTLYSKVGEVNIILLFLGFFILQFLINRIIKKLD